MRNRTRIAHCPRTASGKAVFSSSYATSPSLIDATYHRLARLTNPELDGGPAAVRQLNDAQAALTRGLSA